MWERRKRKGGDYDVYLLNYFNRFLAEATQFLEQHSSRQGIFRKAGSVARQKALKVSCSQGGKRERERERERER